MKRLGVLLAMIAVVASGASAAERQYKGNLDPIGPFEWKDLEGKVWTDTAFKGKVVIVHQWAAWCGACIDGFPETQKLADRVSKDGTIAFISLNLDSDPAKIADWLKDFREEYSFPVLLAGSGLRISRLPLTWIVDSDGYIRDGFSGEGPGYVDQAMALAESVKRRPPVSSLPPETVEAVRAKNKIDAEKTR